MTQFYGEVAPEREMRLEDSNKMAANKKSENVTVITRIRRQFQEYTGRTSIHGLQYIGEKKRPLFERIWWSVVFLSSIGMCGYLIYRVWYKWSTRPVIVSFSETSTPIWQIPFPAVTICSESKAKQSVFNFTQAYYEFMNHSISKADYKKFTDLSLVCDILYYDWRAKLTTNGSSIDFLEEVAPTLKEIGLYCTWHTKLVPCEKLFSPILTEDGLCYTFNILDSNDFFQDIVKNTSYYINHGNLGDSWSLDGGYLRDAPVVTYPYRAMAASNYGHLILTLKSNKMDSDFLCRGPVQGFKIILHNPAEFPVVSQHYYRAPFDEEVLVAIRPNMLTTSQTLRGYDPKQRQCYFPTERHLLFFKVYTQQNCEVECLSNYTNTLCGCVPFFMPRNSSTPICASGSKLCIAKTKDQLAAKDLQDDINELRNNDTDLYFYYRVKGKLVKYEYEDCECLPECTKLEYNAEISQAVYNWKPFYDAKKRKYNKTAELWWVAILLSSTATCGTLILKLRHKWNARPIIVSFAESATPIWQIPFPAVTICSETKTRQYVFNFTKAYYDKWNNSISPEDLKKYTDLSLVCNSDYYIGGDLTVDEDSLEFLEEVAPSLQEMTLYCRWNNKVTPCNDLFNPVLTEDGLCYTFNMLDSNYSFTDVVVGNTYNFNTSTLDDTWSLDDGYLNEAPRITYPHRASSSGSTSGLRFILQGNKRNLDYMCRGPVQGFKIILHNPADVPRVSERYYRAPFDEEILIAIKPNMITTSEDLKSYEPLRRQCYFSTERRLFFYKAYTRRNCEVECLSNYTREICGCVPFYMPRDNSTLICGPGSIQCVDELREQLVELHIENKINKLRENETNLFLHRTVNGKETKYKYDDCECLPECTKLEYNAEISQAAYDWQSLSRAYKLYYNNLAGLCYSRVKIFFTDNQFTALKRNERYGFVEFLADSGGLFGLFIGFTLMSVFEVIYFFGMRIFTEDQE